MRILVACEYSGIVSAAFRMRGHEVWSCDLLPTESVEGRDFHYRGDVREILSDHWDMMIAHPPCTHLASIGAKAWFGKEYAGLQQDAVDFFMLLYRVPHIAKVCVENPVGIMSTVFRQPDQYVEPWNWGDPWRKKTGLWLRGLPRLVREVQRMPNDVEHWVQGQKGRTKDRPGHPTTVGNKALRAHLRARFFPGIARAMAEQWG